MPDIGIRQERLVIEYETTTNDSESNSVKTWLPLRTVWGRAEFQSMRFAESEVKDRVMSTSVVRFTMNYRDDLTVKHRIRWRGSSWNIHEILPTENKMDMTIHSTRVQ